MAFSLLTLPPRFSKRKSVVLLLGMCGGALLFSGFFWIIQPKPTQVVVRIVDGKFIPSAVEVTQNGTVTFKNETGRESLPAADPHPEHTSYGATTLCDDALFDPCTAIPPGGSWHMVFTTPGRVAFHDHFMPSRAGTVTVHPPVTWSTSVTKFTRALHSLMRNDNDVAAFRAMDAVARREAFTRRAKEDPQAAWSFLKSAAIEEGVVLFNVHDLAHIVGNELFRSHGAGGITKCDDTFAYGCRHGVSEAFLATYGPEYVPKIADSCRTAREGNEDVLDTGCIHGIGHGLATWEAYDLSRALPYCDLLPQSDRHYCYDGIFMETFEDRKAEEIETANPWDECSALEERYREKCARYKTVLFTTAYPKDAGAVARLCDQAPEAYLRETCALSIGFYASQTTLGNLSAISDICAQVDIPYAHRQCITGAAKENLFQEYPQAPEVAAALCASLIEPSDVHACIRFIESPTL